ncbi:PREDICTED: coiled-coil domain-containing protein 112 [Galeopterus variegatus]|uniref:Coiled-coil domain-containing protein 112 n=1 Tax=Galeopterus variegatus TaxID=482537 RepID=A0ABM0QIF5_GALVR|nr:PREDICTED: coiled-coil domain-containing protein 112 [Galeopterus variegatus]
MAAESALVPSPAPITGLISSTWRRQVLSPDSICLGGCGREENQANLLEKHLTCPLLLAHNGSPSSWEESPLFYKRLNMSNGFVTGAILSFGHEVTEKIHSMYLSSMPWNESSREKYRAMESSDKVTGGVRATDDAFSALGHGPKQWSPETNDGCFSATGGIRPFHLQNWKQKVSRTKKAEFIRTAEKFKTQVINIEKDKHSHFYNQKSDFRIEHSMLEELENKLIDSRKTERAKIQQQLAKIHNNVKKLQHQLKDVKPTPDFVEKLREMMEEIENAINTFKEEQRLIYEELIKEEKTTNNELSAISRKIDTWALGNSETEKAFRAISSKVPVDKVTPSTLPEEVLDFEKFLQQTGGRQGGWDDYDHQNFVKVRNKHKGKPTFMGEVVEHLPGKTQDEVQQHEKWYQKFLALEERKKESIQNWKTKKQQKKEEIFKLKEKTDNIPMLFHNKREDNQKQKEEQRRKQKLAVEAWKKQKSIEMSMKYASQLKEEEEKEKKQQKERQRQFKLKLLLESYTQQKKEQEEFLRLEKEIREKAKKAEKRKTAADEISRFQERDLHKLELKILDRQAKEDEKAEKQRRLAKLKEKVENNVSRDPSRLYKPTKGWEERNKKIGPTGSGPLLHIPHRAIPTWRQGV